MNLPDRFQISQTTKLLLGLGALSLIASTTNAQDTSPTPPPDKAQQAGAAKKTPRARPRPETSPKAQETEKTSDGDATGVTPVTTKNELAADADATNEELGELLEVHGVTCASCEGDTCSECKMAPLPEGGLRHPRGCDGPRCRMGDMQMHHKKMMRGVENARKSVVRVVNARERGTGFLYGTRNHVITSLAIVESGRATHVVDHNGAEIGAKIIGTDRGAGLALLELDAELSGATPLRAAKGKGAHFGHAFIIGNHYGAGQRWGVDLGKLTNGVARPVTIANGDGDALLLGSSVPETFAGAPIVAPDGRLLGVVRWAHKKRHASIATAAHRVEGFYKAKADKADEYTGHVRLRWGGGLFVFAGNESTFGGGLQMSTSVDFFDMFGLTARLAYGLGWQDRADAEGPSPILSRTYGRFIVDGIAYYRFMMPGFHGQTPISIGVGGAYVNDNGEDRVLVDENFITEDFDYDRGMLEADLQIGWLRGSFFVRPDETEDWFFTLSASMQY